MVRAKFKCDQINRTMSTRALKDAEGNRLKDERGYDLREPCEMWSITMSPVYGNGDPNHENTKFWEASPSGQIWIDCVNKTAVDQFDLGKEFYVDFTPA